MAFWDIFKGTAGGGIFSRKARSKAWNFLTGTPEEEQFVNQLTPVQQKLHDQYLAALAGPGAGGAFGSVADYYRDLLNPEGQAAQTMFAPEMRKYNEQIIPGLSEQFAGMGAGGLSSSGFRNAAVGAGTDLSERLAAIRGQLAQQGAAGLASLAQGGLSPIGENIIREGQPGFLETAAPIAGSIIGTAVGGPIGGAIGGGIGQGIGKLGSQSQSSFGKTSPYGRNKSLSFGGNSQVVRGF